MARNTIDFGIDLGTTNSSIAVLEGTRTEVIPNQDGASITPSAVWFDRRGTQFVGQHAKANGMDDEENLASEFKLRMGQKWQKTFARTGRQMLPEELSAEVLKSLRLDVQANRGEEIDSAVITVPAAFELPQCDATRRAAAAAGFKTFPLLQEPVAAALAYGFQSAANKVFWLVYDFGGGTFDAAVVQVRDGIIQVVNHAGDNFLGGKNIDWDIVEKLLIPRLAAEHPLAGFARNSTKWRSAVAKLKWHAELAKIKISRTRAPAAITIDNLCVDDRGRQVDFVFDLRPSDVESITEPWITQSIHLCKTALSDKGLSGAAIEKVLLVGGSSLFPWLRERLTQEIGARAEHNIDPMTVVARGAAVFAGTQRLEARQEKAQPGTYGLRLEYEPVGSETEPTVGGQITPPPGATASGLSVEIVEVTSRWRSGAIRVSPTGTFVTEVHAEPGRRCEYQVVLTDSQGSRVKCSPDTFSYTVGMVITSPPLTHAVGVAMANNRPLWFFRKGEALPARKNEVLYSAVALRKGVPESDTNVIRIPVIEGTSDHKADRNGTIGAITISPTDRRVTRDVPAGSEIEVTINVDVSRQMTVRAYIPILDEEFEATFTSGMISRSPGELRRELNTEVSRVNELAARATAAGDAKANDAVSRINAEQIVETVRRQVDAAQGDPDAIGEADRKLLALKAAADDIEAALEWPGLVEEAQTRLESARKTVGAHGQPEERQRLTALESEIAEAIKLHRVELLRTRSEDVHDLTMRILLQQPGFWVGYLEYLGEQRAQMTDIAAAQRLFTQAQKAVASNDLEALKAAVRQLIALLPADAQEEAQARGGFGSTIIGGSHGR